MKNGTATKYVTHESRVHDLIPDSVIDATMLHPGVYLMSRIKLNETCWTTGITTETELC